MATKKNKQNRKLLLVFLPVIVVLLIVLLTFIQRVDRPAEPETAVVIEPETGTGTGPEPETEHKTIVEKIIEPETMKGKIYLVIDDVGYNIDQLESFLELECPLTFAILPFLPYSDDAAQRIEKNKKEYIIHMPMEPINGEDPGPGALFTTMETDELRDSASAIISSLSGAQGVNNHMGSRFTSDKKSMNTVLQVLKEEGKFYLDSYTTAESVVEEMCNQNNMVYHKRDVFVDNNQEAENMEKAMRDGFVLAEKRGEAVLIGHVWSDNLPAVIEELYREGIKNGYQFAHLSELYKKDGSS